MFVASRESVNYLRVYLILCTWNVKKGPINAHWLVINLSELYSTNIDKVAAKLLSTQVPDLHVESLQKSFLRM